jgi:signal transduction histidine kinase
MNDQARPGATILVVDDIDANRDLIVTLVRHLGHRAIEAPDGARGLELVRQHRPDLVVTDILMPTMDGFEFVSRLRADPQTAATPVIFYTAHYHEREARNLANICGVSRVLLKPCDPAEVLRVVEQALANAAQAPVRADPLQFDVEHLRLLTDKLSEQLTALETTNRRLAALTELNLHLGSERDVQLLLDKFCKGSRELIGAKYAVLAVNDPEHTTPLYFCSGLSPDLTATRGWPDLEAGAMGRVYRDQHTLCLVNPDGDPAALGLPAGYPALHMALVAPVSSLIHTYGWICLADKVGWDAFSAEDEHIVSILAAQVGRIYENGSLYATAQRHAALLQNEINERQQAELALQEKSRQLSSLSRRILETQELERRRVAHELHDELGQSLTAIKINLQSKLTDRHGTAADGSRTDNMVDIVDIVDQTLAQMRRLALGLRPSLLDDLGLLPALRWLAGQNGKAGQLAITVHHTGELRRFDPDIETVCFRIAQEALTNVQRHAGAGKVEIELSLSGQTVSMKIHDDGRGFNVTDSLRRASSGNSVGLLGMRERATLAGGMLRIESQPGQGTTVLLDCHLETGALLR